MRRLEQIYRAVVSERWDHTSYVSATIAECHRNPEKRSTPITPDELHPFRRKRGSGRGMRLTKELIRAQFEAWKATRPKAIGA